MIENRMLVDSEWGELEYGVPLPRYKSKNERREELYDSDREVIFDPTEDKSPEE